MVAGVQMSCLELGAIDLGPLAIPGAEGTKKPPVRNLWLLCLVSPSDQTHYKVVGGLTWDSRKEGTDGKS